MDHIWEEADSDRDIKEHKAVRYDHDERVLRALKLNVILNGSLSKVVGLDWDNRYIGIILFVISDYLLDLLNQLIVVGDTFHGACHICVIIITESIIETLDISDVDLALPLLSRNLGILIMVQKERELHTTCIELALVTLRCLVLTPSVSKDGEGEDR